MSDKIIEILKEIEITENIEIMFASEVGSRQWGFSNDDSDYDIMFIYRKVNASDYLSLKKSQDVIQYGGDNMDIIGWDIKKALHLHYKNNPNLREMLLSNNVYIDKGITKIFEDLGEFDKNVLKNHYSSIALRHWKKYCGLEFGNTKIKKYLYVIRAILCWNLLDNDIYPPIDISQLLNTSNAGIDDETKNIVLELISYRQSNAVISEKSIFKLNNYILNSLNNMKKVKTTSNKDLNLYDEKFRELLLVR